MANLTSGPKGLYPDTTFLAKDLIPEVLVFKIATIAASVEGDSPLVRVPFVSIDPTSGFSLEGATLTESDPTLSEITIATAKVGLTSRISREASTFATAVNMLQNSLTRAVISKGNIAFLTNAVTAGQPTGLLNIPGIVDAGALAADNVDAVAQAITAIEVNGGKATHIVADPASFGILRLMKAATGSHLPLLGGRGEVTGTNLYGLPVIVDKAMTPGTLLVTDQSNIIAAVGAVSVTVSEDVYFLSDSKGLRVTWRFGHKVIYANRLAKVTVDITP